MGTETHENMLTVLDPLRTADDTELLPDNQVEAAEEDLHLAVDDGIELEPFNLVQVLHPVHG